MTLQTILYGKFVPPPVANTWCYPNFSVERVEAKREKKVREKPVVKQKHERLPSEQTVIEALRASPDSTIEQLVEITGLKKATIYKSISFLSKDGLILRETKSSGTRSYSRAGSYFKIYRATK